MRNLLRVLIVEDSHDDTFLVMRVLQRGVEFPERVELSRDKEAIEHT